MDMELICPYLGLGKRSRLSQKKMSYARKEPFVNAFLDALILELPSSVYIVLAGVWVLGLYRKQQC